MYTIGQAYNPEDDDDDNKFCWTLEIHRVNDEAINDIEHLGCIQIYDETLDLCLLKAKSICNVLNSKGFVGAEKMVVTLNSQKGSQPIF